MRLRRLAAVIFLLLLLPGCGGRSISHRPLLSMMGVQTKPGPAYGRSSGIKNRRVDPCVCAVYPL